MDKRGSLKSDKNWLKKGSLKLYKNLIKIGSLKLYKNLIDCDRLEKIPKLGRINRLVCARLDLEIKRNK